MSIIRKTTSLFLTIIACLIFTTNSLISNEPYILNLPTNMQSDKNIIVKKILSEKCQIQTIDRSSKFSFEVYPNPTFTEEASISVNNSELKIAKITLTNYESGHKIKTYSIIFANGLLKFNKVEKGKYLLTIYLESGDFYSKIIILE